MKYYEVAVETTHVCADYVSAILLECGSEGVAVQDGNDLLELIESGRHWDYIDDSLKQSLNNAVIVKGFYKNLKVVTKIEKELSLLKVNATDCGTLKINSTLLDDSDYLNEWKKYYNPITIGGLIIVPEWLDNPDKSKLPIFIDPGAAFGTGGHATTKMCLNLLQEIKITDKSMLDVGCGSGILSIAGLRLGAKNACLIDIDESAVKVSKSNLALNGLYKKAEFIEGNLVDKINAKYDVVTANLTADILLLLYENLNDYLTDGGYCIISGIIDSKLNCIKACFSEKFEIIKELNENEWNAMLLKLKSVNKDIKNKCQNIKDFL